MMKLNLSFAITLVACTSRAPQGEVATGPSLVLTEGSSGETTHVSSDAEDHSAPVELEGSACSCTTYECAVEWVKDNIGAGLCVDLECNDGSRLGICVPRDESLEPSHVRALHEGQPI